MIRKFIDFCLTLQSPKLKKHLIYAFSYYNYNNFIVIIAISITQFNSEFNNKEKIVIQLDD